MTPAVALVCWAATAHALAPASLSTTISGGAGGTGYADSGLLGTGWMVTGGYFFKDTLFYSGGRGGATFSAGKAFPVLRWLGIWAGGGVWQARGTMDTSGSGSGFRTTFDETVVYADIGVVTPWLPFPVALAFYRQSADISDAGAYGAPVGRTFTGRRTGTGVGVDVRVLFEFFLSKRRGSHRGFGLVAGYAGFMDLVPRTVRTRDAAGGEVVHSNWKAFKGESLQAGVEYEF